MRRLGQSTQLTTGAAGLGHFPEFLAGKSHCSNWEGTEKLALSPCWKTAHPRQTLSELWLAGHTHISGAAFHPREPGLKLIHQPMPAERQLQHLVDLQSVLASSLVSILASSVFLSIFFLLLFLALGSSTMDCQ